MEFRLARINDSYDLSYLKKEVWETTYRGIYDDEVIDNYDYAQKVTKEMKIAWNAFDKNVFSV